MSDKPRFREGQKVFVPLHGLIPKYNGKVSHMMGNKVVVKVTVGTRQENFVYNPEEVKLSRQDTK